MEELASKATAAHGGPWATASNPHTTYFLRPPGQEHYLLLATLAGSCRDSLLVDVGTHFGYSALALSGGSNRVLTLDILDQRAMQLPGSVTFELRNVLTDERAFPLEAPLALFDIDPHSGREERAFVEQLRRRGWKGWLLCDDIHLNAGMEEFWGWAGGLPDLQAVDLTRIGHVTGTGLLKFGGVWDAGLEAALHALQAPGVIG